METANIQELNERVARESAFVDVLTMELGKSIVGQKHMVEGLLIGLLSNGHVLLEGVPGLAKTLTITTLAKAIDARFSRIQFTPDLLPADLIGTMIYSQKNEQFQVKKGPIFSNFILADEINRAPAKVQSALLEAMQERQVTIGEQTFRLEEPFLVMATQNPIEQESGSRCTAIFVSLQDFCWLPSTVACANKWMLAKMLTSNRVRVMIASFVFINAKVGKKAASSTNNSCFLLTILVF